MADTPSRKWTRHWTAAPGADGRQLCVACHAVLVDSKATTPPGRFFPSSAPVYERSAPHRVLTTALAPRDEFQWCTSPEAVSHA